MDVLSLFSDGLGLAWTILSFLVVLGVVVFVHEFGHYIVARWCGIQAEVFSIGFGKELWGWNDRRGTRWRLAALPLGGYVKFLGDGDAASARADLQGLEGLDPELRARAFPSAALWRRTLAVAAGPAFNFILAIAIYAGMALSLGVGSERPVIGAVDQETAGAAFALREGDRILAVEGTEISEFGEILPAFEAASDAQPGRDRFQVAISRGGAEQVLEVGPVVPPVIGRVGPDSPAEAAGLTAGERILQVDDARVGSFADLQRAVVGAGGDPVTLRVAGTDGAEREVTLTPKLNPAPTADGIEMRPLIGVTALPLIGAETVTPGPLQAVGLGAERTWQVIASSLAYIGAMIGGEADSSGLGGPIKIASLSGEAAAVGLVSFLGMIAMISTSIGMINLFPIPVLDGGHLVFYALEALRGRPLGEKATEAATGLGLALVVLLMVFVTYNDIAGL